MRRRTVCRVYGGQLGAWQQVRHAKIEGRPMQLRRLARLAHLRLRLRVQRLMRLQRLRVRRRGVRLRLRRRHRRVFIGLIYLAVAVGACRSPLYRRQLAHAQRRAGLGRQPRGAVLGLARRARRGLLLRREVHRGPRRGGEKGSRRLAGVGAAR